MLKLVFYIFSLFLLITPYEALAYVGPGMGGGFIVAIFGVVLAIFLALFGILYYPIKRLFGKNKKTKKIE